MTPETWEKAKPLIEAAIARGLPTHTADDVKEAIDAGLMQLWCHGGTAMVTEIVEFPQMKACRVAFAGGKLGDIRRMKPDIEKWAREQGCRYMLGGGRKGWTRMWPDYIVSAHQMAKELS